MTNIDEASPEKRGPGRPRIQREPLRTESARVPLRERLRGATRKPSTDGGKFHIPPEMIPEGVSVEWKRHTVAGKEDPFYLSALRQQGWEPGLAEDFPALAYEGMEGPVIKEGMILMVRPSELTEQARAEDHARAKRQVRDREAANGTAPAGTLPRPQTDLAGRPLGVQKEMMVPLPVED